MTRGMPRSIREHPVLAFYALVFAISWGGLLALVGPAGIPGSDEQVGRLFPVALVALFAGPSVAGIVMTGLVSGREGLRELRSRLLSWRAEPRWYAIALLLGPLLVLAVLLALALALTSPLYRAGILSADDKRGLLITGIVWGLVGGGLLEELGWTGFAIPRLRLRHGAFATGLIAGVLWGLWHLPIAFWASASFAGDGSLAHFVGGFLVFYFAALPAFRVLLVRVHDRSGSLPVVMLMHAMLSASTVILQPVAPGMPQVVWNVALAAALWVMVAVVVSLPPGKRFPYGGRAGRP